MRKKKLHLGRVYIPGYVVDLGNKKMVKRAREYLMEDVRRAVLSLDEVELVEVVKDDKAKKSDISDFLLEEDDDEEN